MTPTQKLIAVMLEHLNRPVSLKIVNSYKGSDLWKAIDKIVLPMQQEIDRLNLENEDYAQATD